MFGFDSAIKNLRTSQHLPRCRWGGAVAVLADGLDRKIKTGDPLSSFPIRSSVRVLPPGTLRGVCPRLWSRGPAAAEAPRRVRSRGSHIDLADGLETGSPYFHLYSPGLALSRGGSLSCSSSPLSESALICSSFSPRRFICFVPSGSRVAEATRAWWWSSVHLCTFRPCLLVWVFDCI